MLISPDENIVEIAASLGEKVPIFPVSNVKYIGIEELVKFFRALPLDQRGWNKESEAASELLIGKHYVKPNALILTGMVLKGTFQKEQSVLMGPNSQGCFRKLIIKEI